MYLVKTPWWLKKMYPSLVWDIPATEEQVLYLTFDDGPHETATPFVLDTLAKHHAKAVFFCIGKNVMEHPAVFRRILDEGHRIGNHTQHHLNGWRSPNDVYIADVLEAAKYIDSNLFRPPYGRITKFQAMALQHSTSQNTLHKPFKVIMWNVLSGDFDTKLTGKKCLENVVVHAGNGAVVVFHDSSKAFERLQYALPRVLDFFSEKGFAFKAIPV